VSERIILFTFNALKCFLVKYCPSLYLLLVQVKSIQQYSIPYYLLQDKIFVFEVIWLIKGLLVHECFEFLLIFGSFFIVALLGNKTNLFWVHYKVDVSQCTPHSTNKIFFRIYLIVIVMINYVIYICDTRSHIMVIKTIKTALRNQRK